MIHSTLGIHSLLKKQSLKHNVVDKDRILIPPNWDSWGKIRVVREGFDVAEISKGWSVDIHRPAPKAVAESNITPKNGDIGRVVQIYEDTIKDPRRDSLSDLKSQKTGLDIKVIKNQDFLAAHLETMERLKSEEEKTPEKSQSSTNTSDSAAVGGKAASKNPPFHDSKPITEHIGPVQFNMGGIQVVPEGLIPKTNNNNNNPGSEGKSAAADEKGTTAAAATATAPTPGTPGTPDGNTQTEVLASFFAGLLKRGGGANSPKPTASSS